MERFETDNTKSYLFCVGFDLLGGILRKLESTCLERFFLWARREDEVLFNGQEYASMDGQTLALALVVVDKVNNNSDSVRARATSAMDQLFMVVEDLGSYGFDACCIVSQVKLKMWYYAGEFCIIFVLIHFFITVWNAKDIVIRCHFGFMWDHVLNFSLLHLDLSGLWIWWKWRQKFQRDHVISHVMVLYL